MSEGKEVRLAYDGPEVEHDQLLSQIERQASDEYARASDAGESGARLKEFLEETGLNSQAFSWLKAITKKLPKKDGQQKAMDVIRSLEVGLPMVKAHVEGQGTGEMQLEPEEQDQPEYEGESAEPEDQPTEYSEEQAEFDAEVDEAMGDDAGVVTPIDFEGAAE